MLDEHRPDTRREEGDELLSVCARELHRFLTRRKIRVAIGWNAPLIGAEGTALIVWESFLRGRGYVGGSF